MADTDVTFRLVNTVFLFGVLVTTTMVTCSNDRLEGKVQALTEKVERSTGSGGGGGGDVSALAEELASLRAQLAGGGAKLAAGAATGREPGEESRITAVGWGGRRARVRYVEGAIPNAPLRLEDKPLPQGDAWVTSRPSAPSSLNYYATNEGMTSTISAYSLGRMIGLDPDTLEVIPALATKWEVAEDKLTYVFTLRKGVQHADGRPLTAADVKFSFDVMRDPEVNAEHMRGGFKDVISLEAPDDDTIVVRYSRPYWKGVYTIAYSLRILNKDWYQEIIPEKARELGIEKYAIEPGKPGFGEVFNKIRIPCPGPGPYYLEKGEKFDSSGVKLVQNPFYWGKQIHPERYNLKWLRWRFIKDAVSKFEEFRKGKIDMTSAEADDFDDEYSKDQKLMSMASAHEYSFWTNHASFIAYNCRQPPFDDARVRRAMTHLINRKWVVEELERGRGQVAVCNARLGSPEYTDIEPWPFDVERARELLTEAGWKDTDGDGILDKDGKAFSFEFKTPSARTFFVRLGGAIQDACKKVGIRMHVRPLEWATFIADYDKRRYDAVCLYWSWPDPWVDNYDVYHSSEDIPDGGNAPGWHNDRADELLEQMRVEFDDEKRREMFHEFNHIFHQEQPVTLLVHGKVIVLVNNRFENARVRYGTGLGAVDWWVKPENVLYK
jgi:peptide/nickel transport system substrate-binding protein